MRKGLLIILLFGTQSLFALEDYSYQEEFSVPAPRNIAPPKVKLNPSVARKLRAKGGFHFSLLHDVINVDNAPGNLNTLQLKFSWQTQHRLTLDLSYWKVTDTAAFADPGPGPNKKGNLQAGVLFNWFRYGGNSFDIYGSYNFKKKNSLVAHSYDTKLVGVYGGRRLSRFFNMGLGLRLSELLILMKQQNLI